MNVSVDSPWIRPRTVQNGLLYIVIYIHIYFYSFFWYFSFFFLSMDSPRTEAVDARKDAKKYLGKKW